MAVTLLACYFALQTMLMTIGISSPVSRKRKARVMRIYSYQKLSITCGDAVPNREPSHRAGTQHVRIRRIASAHQPSKITTRMKRMNANTLAAAKP